MTDDVKTSTYAKVTLTIEVSSIGSWGPECALSQVYKQGVESALGAINRLFRADPFFRVVGTPKVEAITVTRE